MIFAMITRGGGRTRLLVDEEASSNSRGIGGEGSGQAAVSGGTGFQIFKFYHTLCHFFVVTDFFCSYFLFTGEEEEAGPDSISYSWSWCSIPVELGDKLMLIFWLGSSWWWLSVGVDVSRRYALSTQLYMHLVIIFKAIMILWYVYCYCYFLCSINARKCDVQQQQKKIPDKNGWYGVDKLSNSIEFYIIWISCSRAFSSYSVARGFSLQKERYKNKPLIDSIGVRRSSESPGRKG